MKLSQKLLALGGVTLADYACCPYDDYGMPHTACTNALPEKTPFSLESDWRNGACKAWESNVDATYDGNDNNCGSNEDWGSCGFQRHFPWNEVNTEDYRNRGCEVEFNNADGSRSKNDGCHCQGFGDAVTTAIVCKTNKVIVETTTPDDDCVTYNALTHGGDAALDLGDFAGFGGNGLCCDPTAAANTFLDDMK